MKYPGTHHNLPKHRGDYILAEMRRMSLDGDNYFSEEDIYHACQRCKKSLSYTAFRSDLASLLREKAVQWEGKGLYLHRQLRYEDSAAACLGNILQNTKLADVFLPAPLSVGDVVLTEKQHAAVELALSHRLSLILGSAGTGKTTLIQAILENHPKGGVVVCAPTGKAARNLTDRTGYKARTVHGALGMVPDEFFLQPVEFKDIKTVVIDECSMMTLEMLAGFLTRVVYDCRVVLVGDPYQLQSVGAGNVIPDLLELGVPSIRLDHIHRQEGAEAALVHNVTRFQELYRRDQLTYDKSFALKAYLEHDIAAALVAEAAQRYLDGENIQVLSPYNRATDLSTYSLNLRIRDKVNPPSEEKLSLITYDGTELRDGDRVMLTKNDRDRNCSNGDIGILRIWANQEEEMEYAVFLPDGRCPRWQDAEGLEIMTLAYVITVHKSQGSEYDAVLMPMAKCITGMLTRNLLYTAISRAKRKVVLFGDAGAVDIAMQRIPRKRRSVLVAKSRMAMRTPA